ncbi:hypothetical protein [Streptomyces tubercidicus]|uniref:hypothetical protein n=2 Tax=Streptomyces tubercidicus TaxID=47759 RepID=UPI002E19799C
MSEARGLAGTAQGEVGEGGPVPAVGLGGEQMTGDFLQRAVLVVQQPGGPVVRAGALVRTGRVDDFPLGVVERGVSPLPG